MSTWRMFDEKDLRIGDEIALVNKNTEEEFARGVVTSVGEKPLGELSEQDFEGHNKYKDQDDMIRHYRGYYGDQVTLKTPIKMIKFKLT